MRELAARAADAAAEIRALTDKSTNLVSQGTNAGKAADEKVQDLVKSFADISRSFERVKDNVGRQAEAFGTNECAVRCLHDSAAENTEVSERRMESAEALQNMSRNLASVVGRLTADATCAVAKTAA